MNNEYQQQSIFSDPGSERDLYRDLPTDIPTLCGIVQNLFLHYADGPIFNYTIPPERYPEMDDRYLAFSLGRMRHVDYPSLTDRRPAKDRVIGICRDMVLLLCSILRYQGVPARLRSGYVNYFIPDVYLDGLCLEYWHSSQQRWVLVDVRTASPQIEHYHLNIDFDLYDVPRDRFVFAEDAWSWCRSLKINPVRFGSRYHRGLWYVRNRLLQSIAFLNRQEMLVWDLWGMMLSDTPEEAYTVPDRQLAILDELSEILLAHPDSIASLKNYYQAHPVLQVPRQLLVCNPFLPPISCEVAL